MGVTHYIGKNCSEATHSTNQLPHQQQFEFRPKHSTETADCYLIGKNKRSFG